MTEQTTPTASCCGGGAKATTVAADGRTDLLSGGTPDAEMTTCPVMVGSPVNKAKAVEAGLYRDFEGERYFFCCAGCGPAFDADPAKYAANMA
ncbi:YHS domain-containing protein [Leucobacter komagatae]|uniref:YHS domain-containing protein n=1 Tax=Leucobacter komagatae TaxID=55969 RepID=A0A542Y5P7_9MICO|nr:YHS domain-containing protein [Leucobacter komagatae]TQL43422.1 YHS domain-containing protein [Leucobacter komagatae]